MRLLGKGSNTARKRPYWLLIPAVLIAAAALLFALKVFPLPAPAPVTATPGPAFTPAITAALAPIKTPAVTATPAPAPSPAASTPNPNQPLGKPVNAPHTRYELAAELHPSYDRLYAKLRVQYQNTTPDTLYELVFNLYPNAFASKDAPGTSEGNHEFDSGRIIVSAVSLNDQLAYFEISDDGMQLHVPLVKELLPGENAQVFIDFAVDVPERNARFGKTEIGYQLGNFLPTLAVYQDGAWVTDAYPDKGDPFYSESADYAVALTYPSDYTLACTGSVVKSETGNGLTTTYAAASRVRDFACTLSIGLQAAQETFEGVRIYSYALSQASAERGAQLAKKALAALTPVIGTYPYETLTVAQVEMYYAGMEYPNLLMVQRELYLPGREMELELTIAHELIHQYFYGVVGSDQINAPWLDEALTSYLSIVYFQKAGNVPAYEALYNRYIVERAPLGTRVDGKLYDYTTEESYVNSVYWRGAAIYHALREEIGDDAFFDGVRVYLQDNAYRIATKADLIAAFEKSSGRSLGAWFEAKLAGTA